MESQLDILDLLEDEEGYVKLTLASGKEVFGFPRCIIFEENDAGLEIIKKLVFYPWPQKRYVLYGLDDIQSYERCKKEDLPQPGGK